MVPHLLNVICQTTGMGFAAIARVTEDKWIACQVQDDIGFGLKSGGELEIRTTICNEIRDSGNGVIINHVSLDNDFKNHHTPAKYGFQSYISMPIFRKNGSFFGTLCAIDPNPRDLKKPEIIDLFNLFADLISFHLEAEEQLDQTLQNLKSQQNFNERLEAKIKERTTELEEKNEMLVKTNKELQEFNYISSHDLQEPLRKIQTFISRIQLSEADNSFDTNSSYLNKISDSVQRMRLLINDLLSYSQTDESRKKFELVDLENILSEVINDLKEEIHHKSADVQIGKMGKVKAIPFQVTQLFYNLIGNSIKYASDKRPLKITVSTAIVDGKDSKNTLAENIEYCQIRISDNGIGFDNKYKDKIFGLFQRLHSKSEYTGTGVGLSIVKKIVENHRGFIEASGTLDKGAEFSIYIPA